jgi:uncharacterized glyoxalase superfamily protein PhnB
MERRRRGARLELAKALQFEWTTNAPADGYTAENAAPGMKESESIMANTQQKLQATSVMPSLTVDDLQKSLDFFSGLGFEIEERWEDKGVLQGVMLKAGETRLGLSQDDGKKGRNRVKGVGMRIYIEASNNIDELAAGAKAAGVALAREPHDTDYGNRAFEVVEPSGFLLTIGSPPSR